MKDGFHVCTTTIHKADRGETENVSIHGITLKKQRFENKSLRLWLVTNQFESKRFIFLENISGLIPNVCSFKSNLEDLYLNLNIDWSLISDHNPWRFIFKALYRSQEVGAEAEFPPDSEKSREKNANKRGKNRGK